MGENSGIHHNKERFEPNFLISVDESAYLGGLANRLGVEVGDLEEALTLREPGGAHRIPIISDDLFRWVIVSLYLCYDLDIRHPSARYIFRLEGGSLVASGRATTHRGLDRSNCTNVTYHKHLKWPVDFTIVERLAENEIYYRPVDGNMILCLLPSAVFGRLFIQYFPIKPS